MTSLLTGPKNPNTNKQTKRDYIRVFTLKFFSQFPYIFNVIFHLTPMFFKSYSDFWNQTLTCLWKCFIGELENCFKLQNKTNFNNIYEIWTGHNREMSRLMTKPTKWLCAQRRLISARAFAQCDQSSLCAQWVAKDPRVLRADSEKLWSDWVDAQADPSLRWTQMPFCWFCHETAQIWSAGHSDKTPHTFLVWNMTDRFVILFAFEYKVQN